MDVAALAGKSFRGNHNVVPRSSRLSRSSFAEVGKRGKRLSSAHFSLTLSSTTPGYAVVVSKKVAKLAVARHKLKRKVTAALSSLTLPPGLIVYPKVSAGTLSVAEIKKELSSVLSKI